MSKQDVIIRFQLHKAAVHDGAFTLVVRNPGAGLGLLACMMAHLHQGVDDIFKSIHVVVDEQQTFLVFNQLLFQHINVFLFLVHFFQSNFGVKIRIISETGPEKSPEKFFFLLLPPELNCTPCPTAS